MVRRGLLLLVLAALPWYAACVLLVGWASLGGLHDAAGTAAFLAEPPMVLGPLGCLGVAVAVDVLYLGRRPPGRNRNWEAGGIYALASTLACAAAGLVGGPLWSGIVLVGAVFSGYWGIAWLVGARVWRTGRTCGDVLPCT